MLGTTTKICIRCHAAKHQAEFCTLYLVLPVIHIHRNVQYFVYRPPWSKNLPIVQYQQFLLLLDTAHGVNFTALLCFLPCVGYTAYTEHGKWLLTS